MIPAIIIPAHNEEKNIFQTLSAIYADCGTHYHIYVICNGTSDNTSAIIKEFFPNVFCHEIEEASKIQAICYAESLKPGFPRIYLDADIVLTDGSALELIKAAQAITAPCLILPRAKINTDAASCWVQLYYSHWQQTEHVKTLGYGSGTYVLSKESRAVFQEWPAVISDDGFIRSHFNRDEIKIIKHAFAIAKPPKTLIQLIKIKIRSKYGMLELRRVLPEQRNCRKMSRKNILANSVGSTINYSLINLIALIFAHYYTKMNNFTWFKDDSNH